MRDFFLAEGFSFNIHTQIYNDINGNCKLPIELELSKKEYAKAFYLSDRILNRKFPLRNYDNNKLCKEFSSSLYICANSNIIPCAKYRHAIDNIYKNDISNV